MKLARPATLVATMALALPSFAGTASNDDLLGGPLVVNGTEIPQNAIKRFLCLGVGFAESDLARLRLIIDQELQMRAAAGEDISKYQVQPERVEREIEKQRVDFLERYPMLDFPTEVGRAHLSLDLYVEQVGTTMLFDNVFFPENPEEWPALTKEAVVMQGTQAFVDDALDSYVQRKTMRDEKVAEVQQELTVAEDAVANGREPHRPVADIKADLEEAQIIQPDDPIFTGTLRAWVIEALTNFAMVEYVDFTPDLEAQKAKLAAGGLGAEEQAEVEAKIAAFEADQVLMTVDGQVVLIDEVYQRVRPHVNEFNLRDARQFLVLEELLRQHFAEKKVLIPFEEFAGSWAENMSFQEALGYYEILARSVRGFPSTISYARYSQLLESYKKLIKEEIENDDLLRSILPDVNKIAGSAKIDAESIMCTAYDYDNVRWKENGFEGARARAEAIKKELDEGADWGEVLDLKSEFWDPPMPVSGKSPPQFGFNFKGRFGVQTRNQFIKRFDESDFTKFLRAGNSVADEIFFNQDVGTIHGPLRGERGYYIARVTSRTPATTSLNLSTELHRNFLVDHYAANGMAKLAHELLSGAEVTGW